jgi:NTP pyrophosphatase (non-canonical NTP hydrolase)
VRRAGAHARVQPEVPGRRARFGARRDRGQTWGDYIALLHSEIGEALEAYRDHRLADATETYCKYENESDPADKRYHLEQGKPEGVGSEFADVLIRLVDMMDVFGKPLPGGTIAEVVANWPALPVEEMLAGESFGGWMAWLHHWVDKLWLEPENGMRWCVGQQMLAALAVAADHFGIDLEAEYVRKTAYNRTRPYQHGNEHGGRTLAGTKEIKNAHS